MIGEKKTKNLIELVDKLIDLIKGNKIDKLDRMVRQ